MKSALAGAALALTSLTTSVTAKIIPRQAGQLPTVTSEGNAFWAGDERLYIRGVAYQPGGAADAADPLLDMQSLQRDVQRFVELGINTIRVYTIDNSQNHDEAMALLDENGIYLALDANTPDYSLNRENLDSLHASYNDVYLQSVFATIDAFAGYNNLLLFFSGNEVINAKNNTNAAPYIKAVTRDMKNYIRAQSSRPIPVGYSSADVAENIESQALYFACGEDEVARSDFFAFNDYSWCDPSDFQKSGWNIKVQTYSNYSLPLFLSEFGCITNTREWNEIAALYSNRMTGVYSGGLAYEYTLEANGYGLVELANGKVTPNADFRRLKEAYAATPNPSGDGGARTSRTVPSCPPETEEWQVSTTLLPEMPEGAQQYMQNAAGTGPGLDGDGSQWAGTPSNTDPDLSNGVATSDAESTNYNNSSGDADDAEGTASSARPVTVLTIAVLGIALVIASFDYKSFDILPAIISSPLFHRYREPHIIGISVAVAGHSKITNMLASHIFAAMALLTHHRVAASNTLSRCIDMTIPLSIASTVRQFPAEFNLDTLNLSSVPYLPATSVSGDYTISASYCAPEKVVPSRRGTLQVLVHGVSYTKNYWSGLLHPPHSINGTTYSWIDYASEQGYATLSIDRLCNGHSSHPPSALACQMENQVSILHAVISAARAGHIAGHRFSTIIPVGHSYGSAIISALVRLHPTLVPGIVLTGFTSSFNPLVQAALAAGSFDRPPAHVQDPRKYPRLDKYYLAPESNKTAFVEGFYAGAFSPDVVDFDYKHSGPTNVFEVATIEISQLPAPGYRGAVVLLNGQLDALACPSNCTGFTPETNELYPDARAFAASNTLDTAHDVNLHLTARESYGVVFEDLRRQGF